MFFLKINYNTEYTEFLRSSYRVFSEESIFFFLDEYFSFIFLLKKIDKILLCFHLINFLF